MSNKPFWKQSFSGKNLFARKYMYIYVYIFIYIHILVLMAAHHTGISQFVTSLLQISHKVRKTPFQNRTQKPFLIALITAKRNPPNSDYFWFITEVRLYLPFFLAKWFLLNQPKLYRIYHFPINVRPNEIPFVEKSIGKWLLDCWKWPKLLRCRKAYSFQAIKYVVPNFDSINWKLESRLCQNFMFLSFILSQK